MYVDQAGDRLDLGRELGGEGIIRVQILAANLYVDRRRNAEIKNFGGDVPGQEVELRPRETLRQAGTQDLPVGGDWRGRVVERDGEVTILAADCTGIAVGLVDAAGRQSAVKQRVGDVTRQ